jgi:hypothetical protein
MIDLIREGRICMAMVGLLYALPNTQLTRRLRSEQRLLADHGAPIADADQMADQISSGLNFVTRRPRRDVIHDLVHVIQSIYSVPSYFDRCLAVCRELGVRPRYKPSWPRALVYVRGFLRTSLRLGLRPSTAWPYWRNVGLLLVTRPRTLETVVSLMAMYLHFRKQSRFIVDAMKARVRDEEVRYPATSSAVPF